MVSDMAAWERRQARFLAGVRMPPPSTGSRVLGRALRDARTSTGTTTHAAQVMSDPDTDGRVQVLIGGMAKTATLGATARAVTAGDRVTVVKTAGEWVITGSVTWRVAPTAARVNATPVNYSTNTDTMADLTRQRLNDTTAKIDALYAAVKAARIVKEP